MARDALIRALADAEGFPVPTAEEFAERIERSLDRHGFEVRTKHSQPTDRDRLEADMVGFLTVCWGCFLGRHERNVQNCPCCRSGHTG